jgi:hypothetical protein
MNKLLLAACAAITLGAPAAHADANLGASPTNVREWFRTTTAVVTEGIVPPDSHRECTLNLMNGATTFGVITTGPAVQIMLWNGNDTTAFTTGFIRIQIDNYTPWRIGGGADPFTPNMFLSEKMNDTSGGQFIPQLMAGHTLYAQTASGVYQFSLADSVAAFQATVACETAITGHGPTVRPTAPATRDQLL